VPHRWRRWWASGPPPPYLPPPPSPRLHRDTRRDPSATLPRPPARHFQGLPGDVIGRSPHHGEVSAPSPPRLDAPLLLLRGCLRWRRQVETPPPPDGHLQGVPQDAVPHRWRRCCASGQLPLSPPLLHHPPRHG
ncbi:unnamed protein product, partial [Ectocarpus sp. 8 AP-2014]